MDHAGHIFAAHRQCRNRACRMRDWSTEGASGLRRGSRSETAGDDALLTGTMFVDDCLSWVIWGDRLVWRVAGADEIA
jgi:hypothetical protein